MPKQKTWLQREWQRRRVLRAAGVVDNQHDVDAVDFQQVHKEAAVALRIQPHGSHVLSSQGRISTHCHLRQGLEDSVVLLHEEPEVKLHTDHLELIVNVKVFNLNIKVFISSKWLITLDQ